MQAIPPVIFPVWKTEQEEGIQARESQATGNKLYWMIILTV
jgi:hypothetical protein